MILFVSYDVMHWHGVHRASQLRLLQISAWNKSITPAASRACTSTPTSSKTSWSRSRTSGTRKLRHSGCLFPRPLPSLCCSRRCVAACCSALQCVAVCCSVLQCAAVCCSVLQCAAVCCSMLRYVADLNVASLRLFNPETLALFVLLNKVCVCGNVRLEEFHLTQLI